VVSYGQHNLAQVAQQSIDLSLLQRSHQRGIDGDGPITAEWIERNIEVDQVVVFGSDEYFALAGDAAVRPLLQSGPNVIFAYQGQVIAVQDAEGAQGNHGR
jgi:hypothetical protein